MNILIIAKPECYESRRFMEVSPNVTCTPMKALRFSISKKTSRIIIEGKPIHEAYDIIIMRSFYPFISEALFLSEYSAKHGMKVFDPSFAQGTYIQSKMYDYWKLTENNIPIPPTLHAISLDDAQYAIKNLPFPLIVKGIHGSQGKYVFQINNDSDLQKTLTQNLVGSFLFQPYYAIEKEYRAIVIGGKFFGAIRKYAPPNDFRANCTLGGNAEPAILSPELISLSEQATHALNYTFAGVDIAIVDGAPLILEVNRTPGFAYFEKATGKDVAKAYIEHVTAH